MAKVIQKLGIKRELGWLYFVDKQGNVSRVERAQGAVKGKIYKRERVVETKLVRDKSKIYFLDKNGDLAETELTRKRGKAKK